MMVTAVLIDDEQNNIDNLDLLLQQHCPQVKVVGTARNAGEGEAIIVRCKPDIVFLDVQMPGRDGFSLLRSLPIHTFELIFVTAFDQYGVQAIKFSAIDYLLKPIDSEELRSAVQKAIYRSTEKKKNSKLENLLEVLEHSHRKDIHRIALPSARETRFIRTSDLIRCESSNNYTTFYVDGGEKIMTSKPIYEYEEVLLQYGFIRCHQSHLVNKKHIRSLLKDDGGFLLMTDGSQVPVSRQKRDQVKTALENN